MPEPVECSPDKEVRGHFDDHRQEEVKEDIASDVDGVQGHPVVDQRHRWPGQKRERHCSGTIVRDYDKTQGSLRIWVVPIPIVCSLSLCNINRYIWQRELLILALQLSLSVNVLKEHNHVYFRNAGFQCFI